MQPRSQRGNQMIAGLLIAAIVGWGAPSLARAQPPHRQAPIVIPVSGVLLTADGVPRAGDTLLTVSLYEGKDDPAPRWIEHQMVPVDRAGRYTVQFGGARDEGLPPDLFTGAVPTMWIGISVSGEPEQPRVMLVAMPYAAKAASADTLAGKAATEFLQVSTFRQDLRTALLAERVATADEDGDVDGEAVTGNYILKGDSDGAMTDSVAPIYEDTRGRVGIGTTLPTSRLHLVDGIEAEFRMQRIGGALAVVRGVGGYTDLGSFSPHPLRLFTSSLERMRITATGDVGIGVEFPWQKLVVAGDTAVTGNLGVGISYPNARLHVGGDAQVAGNASIEGNVWVSGTLRGNNILAHYQDVAEWVDSSEALEAGTVVAIDRHGANRVVASLRARDPSVAGAVSRQPGLALGEPGEGKLLIAQSGRVRIKADARYGAIHPGDLLVTSPTRGHAMRSNAGDVRPGQVLGKALESLPAGQGEILALLTLQ